MRAGRALSLIRETSLGCATTAGVLVAVVVATLTCGAGPWTGLALVAGTGAVLGAVVPLLSRRATVVALPLGMLLADAFLGRMLLVRVDVMVWATVLVGVVAVWLVRWRVLPAVALVAAAGVVTLPVAAGAWSSYQPSAGDPLAVADNGIVVSRDTHAFLIQQGAVVLRHDGRTSVADFLARPDPTAPMRKRPDGTPLRRHENYLWRVQLGARDADGVLKTAVMPDHFFNFWTHHGKGVVAGPSAATYAEEQMAQAERLWRSGDRAGAMYHLGASVHLVADACAPPHESPLIPNHRMYEEWVVAHQQDWAVDSGGIYQADFRVDGGHGGPDWSSAHPRGWVDECAHRAAGYVVNTMQPAPDGSTSSFPYGGTRQQFEDAQRMTAGYLAFFFDRVGQP